jgi:hypothetical protein
MWLSYDAAWTATRDLRTGSDLRRCATIGARRHKLPHRGHHRVSDVRQYRLILICLPFAIETSRRWSRCWGSVGEVP